MRLAPGGVFAFSHREPVVGRYSAQEMGGKWLEGREMELTVRRWQYGPEQWSDILKRHGLTTTDARVLSNPDRAALGTLLITAPSRPDRRGVSTLIDGYTAVRPAGPPARTARAEPRLPEYAPHRS
ncbi:hypothetical protein [Streptomyces sp. WAC01280]|uniref:hypothetical protein n=1 Tax=Streptomyces sp. WAC01280 TaxID=2487424 RepID=UPI00163C2ABD|nr:hypothetical protein [Streptomyces sp. WAC01280]